MGSTRFQKNRRKTQRRRKARRNNDRISLEMWMEEMAGDDQSVMRNPSRKQPATKHRRTVCNRTFVRMFGKSRRNRSVTVKTFTSPERVHRTGTYLDRAFKEKAHGKAQNLHD